MKTITLKGIALNWAVAQIEHAGKEMGVHAHSYQLVIPELDVPHCFYNAQSNWDIAGPIIEREHISVQWADGCWVAVQDRYEWCLNNEGTPPLNFGKTPLEAAMRCFVISKLGDEIDIPEDMLS